MKRSLSFLLALALCLSLGTAAFAADYCSQTFVSQYDYMDATTVTIDKFSGSQYDAHIPVGATVTVTAGDAVIGGACTLCISKAYYFPNNGLLAVHWSYDPASGTMVRTDEQDCIGHSNCPQLTAGQTCSFVVTQEMADSFAVFSGVENPYIFLDSGIDLDYGRGITVQLTFDSAAPAQPEAPETPAAPVFTDVQPGIWYADAVTWAVENGITNGTTATTFSPDMTCSTAHIITFIWRALGSPEPASATPFADVKADSYFAQSSAWAYEKGMVTGSAFEGDKPCTRAAAMEYFWKQAGSPAAAVTDKFTDVDAGASYAQAVAWAVENGLTNGTSDTTFSPDMTMTRGQIVTLLYRALVG